MFRKYARKDGPVSTTGRIGGPRWQAEGPGKGKKTVALVRILSLVLIARGLVERRYWRPLVTQRLVATSMEETQD